MNEGYSAEALAELRAECKELKQNFVINTENGEERDAEGAYFYFIGKHEGKEVIYDTFLYTLRMEYEMQLYDAAEERMITKFPNFSQAKATEDQLEYFDFLLAELEEDDFVKVQEFVQIDNTVEFGVSIDACLNIEEVTDEAITKFVNDFNSGKLKLDDSEYSFSNFEEEEEDEEPKKANAK
jgi:hypothetical protein